ncbi:MAG TPA: M67 family peptidase [Nitrospirales bacterium]|nr:M67 family peptidase [Nitrospirales bacterium]HIA14104.1 M67 family peptidase [Nitrospirales bacterium]HIC04808.1 M67 family peptidase [Nitrospirales bacterium]HIO69286.1 M67 family peptidase [Nitrospirales bacterium]
MLHIPQSIIDEMTAHARSLDPVECCGIMAGTTSGENAHVSHIYQIKNGDNSPVSYFMDPKELLWVHKNMRSNQLDLLVIYHSHTHTQAYPSATDVRLAFYPEAHYVIISLEMKDQPNIKAFRIVDGKIDSAELLVVNPSSK